MRLIIVLSYWMIYLYFYRDKISHKQNNPNLKQTIYNI
jgi:hypothetical protein